MGTFLPLRRFYDRLEERFARLQLLGNLCLIPFRIKRFEEYTR
jgi:hypothetical protein